MYFSLAAMDCRSPYCMNNTELVIVDGKDPGSNATYVCDDGYAVVADGGERSSMISTVCEIEQSPTPSIKWKQLTIECQRTFIYCFYSHLFQVLCNLVCHINSSFTAAVTFTDISYDDITNSISLYY